MQKGISAIVVILVICIVIGLIWWGSILLQVKKNYDTTSDFVAPSPSPSLIRKVEIDEDNNVQIYTNDKYKYQLEFPINWYISPEDKYNEHVTQFVKFLPGSEEDALKYQERLGYSVSILFQNNPQKVTAEQDWLNRIKEGRARNPDYKKVTIADIKGIEQKDNRLDTSGIQRTIAYKDYLIFFSLDLYNSDSIEGLKKFPESEKIFNQVVSFFKFLD